MKQQKDNFHSKQKSPQGTPNPNKRTSIPSLSRQIPKLPETDAPRLPILIKNNTLLLKPQPLLITKRPTPNMLANLPLPFIPTQRPIRRQHAMARDLGREGVSAHCVAHSSRAGV